MRAITLSLFAVWFAAVATAQTKPNFSGTWKLNVAKSDFAVMPPPESQTSVITHNEPSLKVATSMVGQQGKTEYTLDLTTDGKESSVKMGQREAKVTAAWEGPALVLSTKLTFNEQEVALRSSMTLADDGKTLTQNVHYTTAMGEFDQKLLFEKQSDDAASATATATASAKTTPKASETAKDMPAGTTAPSGDRPNFSGVWKLMVDKSDFGVLPPPESRIDTIEHNEPVVKLSRDEKGPQGAQKYVFSTSNDGKEVVNQISGIEARVTANWEGPNLVSNIKLKLPDADITIKQVSSLSADGKTLTNKNHIMSPMGELDTTEVYEKQ
ncbi:MAG: hypothetical protein JO022_12225 [Acidobacteriaceae bacterium]|nr:hypothetical protein [Acidobacteriaceae bacterium]